MIKQNAIAGVDPVGFAIIDGDPVCVKFGNGIGRAWIERRSFFLWCFLNEAVKLRCGSLIETGLFLQAQDANRFQHAQGAKRVRFDRILRLLKRYSHVTLRRQVINLIRLNNLDGANQAAVICHVAIMKKEMAALGMRVLNEMVNPAGIKR